MAGSIEVEASGLTPAQLTPPFELFELPQLKATAPRRAVIAPKASRPFPWIMHPQYSPAFPRGIGHMSDTHPSRMRRAPNERHPSRRLGRLPAGIRRFTRALDEESDEETVRRGPGVRRDGVRKHKTKR